MKTTFAFASFAVLACLAPAHATHDHAAAHARQRDVAARARQKHDGRDVVYNVVTATVEQFVTVTVTPGQGVPVQEENFQGRGKGGGGRAATTTTTTTTPTPSSSTSTLSTSYVAAPTSSPTSGGGGAGAGGNVITGGSGATSNMLEAPGMATVVNNCGFNLYLVSINPGGQDVHPSELNGYTIPPGSSYTEHMRYCEGDCGGVSMKVYQDESMSGPLTQLEYTLITVTNEFNPTMALWYDISFVNCAKKADGTMGSVGSVYTDPASMPMDGSDCPGWLYGMSVSSDTPGSDKYSCNPSEYCPQDIYFVDSYADKMPPDVKEPTGRSSDPSLSSSVTFEVCSSAYKWPKRSIAGRILW